VIYCFYYKSVRHFFQKSNAVFSEEKAKPLKIKRSHIAIFQNIICPGISLQVVIHNKKIHINQIFEVGKNRSIATISFKTVTAAYCWQGLFGNLFTYNQCKIAYWTFSSYVFSVLHTIWLKQI